MRCFTEKLRLPEGGQCAEYTAYLLDSDHLKPGLARPAVIVCPGGSYGHLSKREGEPIAMQFLAMGCHGFVLRYSVGDVRFPVALLELALMVSTVRAHCAEWQVDADRIVVSGFSAGGHLACSLGAFWNRDWVYGLLGLTAQQVQPNGMLLGYPVISAGPFCHAGSFRNLLGEKADEEELRRLVSLEYQVGPHTPSTFLWHMMTDRSVPVQNSLLLAQALAGHQVSLELHIYPVGVHGLALGTEETAGDTGKYLEPRCTGWISLAKSWLEQLETSQLNA